MRRLPRSTSLIVQCLVTLLAPLSVLAAAQEPDDLEFVREALADPSVNEFVIPAGTYTANRPIVMNRSGVKLKGEGKVIIQLADNANSPLLIMGNVETPPVPVYDLKVDNIIFNGNRRNQSLECWGGPCDSGGVTNIRNNGITIRGVHKALITNIQTVSMRSGGIVTEKVSSRLHINGWTSKDNYFDGFAGYETTQSLFENLDLSENMGAGISLDIHFHRNIFRKVVMNKNMDVGIFMRDSNGNKFKDLSSFDSGNHAIFLSQVENQAETVPVDNTFIRLVIDGAKGNGFHLNNAGTGNKLIDPNIQNVRGQNVFTVAPGLLKISRTQCFELMLKH